MRVLRSLVLTHVVDPAASIETILDWLAAVDRPEPASSAASRRPRRRIPSLGLAVRSKALESGSRRWPVHAGAMLMLLSLADPAGGQTYQGAIRGSVRDQQGVVPGAEITLTNEETNSSRSVLSNDVGEYVFTGVLPGSYSLKVTLTGFRAEERTGLRVGTQQTLVQDFTLQIGQLSEQITVTGEAPLIERTSATVAASLDKETLQSLPIFGRNAFYAAISTPAVIQTGDPQFVRYQDQTNASYLSLGGGPRRGNGYLLEGVPITDFYNRPTIVPSIEAVDEVRVQTKTYEADMGHASGGVFNTTARSGSNVWHGSGLYITKPGWATGQLYFAKRAGIENPPQYYRDWAGSIGGPIVKSRTFFWLSTDNYEQLGTRNNVLTLPTALERGGDFSQTRNAAGQLVTIYDPLTTRLDPVTGQYIRDPFPGNIIPASRINPVARNALAAMPLPTSGKSFNGVASLLDGPQHQVTLKADHRWRDNWTTTGMYARQKTREPGSAFFGSSVRFRAIRARRCCCGRWTSSRSTTCSSRTTRRRSPCATVTTGFSTAAITTRSSMRCRSACRRRTSTR